MKGLTEAERMKLVQVREDAATRLREAKDQARKMTELILALDGILQDAPVNGEKGGAR